MQIWDMRLNEYLRYWSLKALKSVSVTLYKLQMQKHAMNEKKLLNHQWLNRVHSSMWQEEQDHQKTETQWISRDHAECQTILERTVQNCKMSKIFSSSLSACSLWLWHYLDAVCMLNYM